RLAPESVRLLAVGALVPRKGHERLIEALAGATDLDWRLTIAGEGARRDPAHEAGLRIRIDAAGLGDRIRLEMPAPDR
ncbi:glycosyltransferase, partial [Escherichia coli]|uniref:glycosyltransferase n=1 Tax=Escherichia coli TaxID=562 RepID=UPI0039DFB93E